MSKEVFPRKGSNGSGSTPCYSVEARTSDGKPSEVGGQLFYGEWRTVRFEKTRFPDVGVPMGRDEVAKHGLMSYACAQAMRWWFHAANELAFCIETRIVKHVIQHSYTEEIVAAFDDVRSFECHSPKASLQSSDVGEEK